MFKYYDLQKNLRWKYTTFSWYYYSQNFYFLATVSSLIKDCGFYRKHDATTNTFSFNGPGYPLSYPNYAHCIWLVEAPEGYGIRLTVGRLRSKKGSDGECLDYLEVR